MTYFQTGLVPRLPTAVLSVGLVVLAMLSFTCGLILDFSRARAAGGQASRLPLCAVCVGRLKPRGRRTGNFVCAAQRLVSAWRWLDGECQRARMGY